MKPQRSPSPGIFGIKTGQLASMLIAGVCSGLAWRVLARSAATPWVLSLLTDATMYTATYLLVCLAAMSVAFLAGAGRSANTHTADRGMPGGIVIAAAAVTVLAHWFAAGRPTARFRPEQWIGFEIPLLLVHAVCGYLILRALFALRLRPPIKTAVFIGVSAVGFAASTLVLGLRGENALFLLVLWAAGAAALVLCVLIAASFRMWARGRWADR